MRTSRIKDWPRWRTIALLGAIVAATAGSTAAAFTDSASVTAQVAAGTINIQVNGAEGNPTPIVVTLPLAQFKPGDVTSTVVQIKNVGSLPAKVTTTVAGTGPSALGAQLDATLTATTTGAAASGKANGVTLGAQTVAPGQTLPVEVRLSLPASTDNTWQGKSDTLTVTLNAAQE